MKEKLWPSIVRVTKATKITTADLFQQIHAKICEDFVTEVISQNTNDMSKQAAVTLWCPLDENELKMHEQFNQINIQSYHNLLEKLISFLQIDTL